MWRAIQEALGMESPEFIRSRELIKDPYMAKMLGMMDQIGPNLYWSKDKKTLIEYDPSKPVPPKEIKLLPDVLPEGKAQIIVDPASRNMQFIPSKNAGRSKSIISDALIEE